MNHSIWVVLVLRNSRIKHHPLRTDHGSFVVRQGDAAESMVLDPDHHSREFLSCFYEGRPGR